jgi:salicylate hydroxylase
LQESGDKVQIQFEDGTSAAADLVVGCDGIHSAIRNQFVADNPSYSGRVAFRGLVPIEQPKSWWLFQTYSSSWLGKDKHFLVFTISQNKILNIVAFVSIKKEELGTLQESWTATGDRAEVAKHFEDFDEPVRKIIGLMGPKPSKWILNDRNPIEQWTFMDGKVVMVGDAAHAMLPHQGQ